MVTERIFLIGFMGCGKSFTGRTLAQLLNYRFLDLDDRIEENAGKTISAIFTDAGEAGFRQLERQALHDLAGETRLIIATGGGAPCFFDNMDWMNRHGLTVYLAAPPALLADRLRPGRAHRPLIAGLPDEELLNFIAGKLAERAPIYQRARITIHQRSTEEDAAGLILQEMRKLSES